MPSSFRNVGYPGFVLDLREVVPSDGRGVAIIRPECEPEGARAERQSRQSQQWYLQKETSEVLHQTAAEWSKSSLDRENAPST